MSSLSAPLVTHITPGPREAAAKGPTWRSLLFGVVVLAVLAVGVLMAVGGRDKGGAPSGHFLACDAGTSACLPLAGSYAQHLQYDVGDGKSGHLLIKEPTLCDGAVRQYSGYFTVDEALDKKYFFWFFESRHSPASSPTTLWLSGGPGASSLFAMLRENGPCTVNPDGRSTTLNPHSWTEASNMLWVDQPAGTGFSTGTYDSNGDQVAEDMYIFLQSFFHHFPQYNKDVHITGESFGGKYVPNLAAMVVKQNKMVEAKIAPASRVFLDFKGMAIGNGDPDITTHTKWYAHMAYDSGSAPSVVNRTTFVHMQELAVETVASIEKCILAIDQGLVTNSQWLAETAPQDCKDANYRFDNWMMGPVSDQGINLFDLRLHSEYDYSALEVYLNSEAVHKEIGALKRWTCIDDEVNNHLHPNDFFRVYSKQAEEVLASGAKVLVYAGDQDYICNWLGNQAWANGLQWAHQREFVEEERRGYGREEEGGNGPLVIGELKHFANLAFLRVYGAGHMVPMDRPAESLEMFKQFLSGRIFA